MKVRTKDQPSDDRASDIEAMGIVEHDINNILMITKGYLDLVRLDQGNHSDAAKTSLIIAIRGVDNLARLVADLMDIARMEARRLIINAEKTSISRLISDVIGKMKDVALEAGVELTAGGRGPVQKAIACNIDKGLVSRALADLITNAVKYAPSGGRILVIAEEKKDIIEISVRDTGLSIPPEYRKKVFEKSAQPEIGKANVRRGIGLSLIFCRLVAELHGGKIRVESPDGETGSIFIVTIPKN
jgi:signal transduction histidine kinase